METNPASYRGCLLGLAVGDAMGATVDAKSYEKICQTYGPAGLLGYDLVNGFAAISSYTQVAGYVCNGLLLSITRGHMGSNAGMRYSVQALKEWARMQHLPGDPEKRVCWLSQAADFRQRRCMDARTLDALTRDVLGTPEKPANRADGPGTLTAAVAAGLFFHPQRMQFQEIGIMGAQIVALTHGDPMTFLSGAVLAYVIAALIHDPDSDLEEHFRQAAQAVENQFGGEFSEAKALRALLEQAIELSRQPQIPHWQAMEQLGCHTGAQVLAGAVYAVLAGGCDFDAAIIIAVNHSGKSAAVGAVTGAILGAYLSEEALPEFYLECLPPAAVLRELATDLYNASPKGLRTRLFDDVWDRKYTHGQLVEHTGWAVE